MTARRRLAAEPPFSPQTLAERWDCSAEHVRRMYRNGEIAGFELGKLIRIPAAEVYRFECQNIPSHGTEESLPSHGESQDESIRDGSRLARIIADRPKLSPVTSGNAFTPREANG